MKKIISTAGLIALAVAGVGGIEGVAEAGQAPASEGDVIITYQIFGPAAAEISDAITPELYDPTDTLVTGCATSPGSGEDVVYTCTDVPFGNDYEVGLADLPAPGEVVGVFCDVIANRQTSQLGLGGEFPNANFDHFSPTTMCTVNIDSHPGIFLDTVVIGGPATVADFSYDIVDSTDATVATGVTDPSATNCVLLSLPFDAPPTDCSSDFLPEGTYSIAANAIAPSYVATDFECVRDDLGGGDLELNSGEEEVTTDPAATEPGEFLHDPIEAPGTVCTTTYNYVTQLISVDVVVTNDDGGTAVADDFTIELRDSTDTIIATGTDPEPGTGNGSAEFIVPLGEYTVTATGPSGYTITVDVTVVERPADVAMAGFTVTDTQTASVVVNADDPAPATTTTLPPTTTQPAPTTTINPTDILPATGSSDSTMPLLLLAGLLVVAGGGTVALTRRR